MTSAKRKAPAAAAAAAAEDDSVGIRYSCDYCFRDITSVVRIQCAECGLAHGEDASPATDEVDLCVECFAAGVEFGGHRADHAYRVLRPLDFAVFAPDWRADEEMLLLEAVEAHGVGNWADVAEHLGGGRTAEEVSAHYLAVYMRPDIVDGTVSYGGGVPGLLPPGHVEHSRALLAEPRPKRPRASPAPETPTPQSVPANHELAGFMPLRSEFETEIENDAEASVKDIVFAEGPEEHEEPAEAALKLTILDIYGAVLDRRAARRSFAIGRGLVDFRRQQNTDKMRSKEEREAYAALKPYARFLAAADMQALLDGVVREEELRRQIATLQDYRRHGLRSFADVPAFETDRKALDAFLRLGARPPAGSLSVREPQTLPAPGTSPVPLLTPVPTARGGLAAVLDSSGDMPVVGRAPSPAPSPPAALASGRKSSTPLDLSGTEGLELLSPAERELCATLRLYPRAYMAIKDVLLLEAQRHGGHLRRAQARAAVKIDVNKTSRLYDYFVSVGWIAPFAVGE